MKYRVYFQEITTCYVDVNAPFPAAAEAKARLNPAQRGRIVGEPSVMPGSFTAEPLIENEETETNE